MENKTPGKRWYEQHLKSEHFQAIRRRKWKDCGGRCESCGELFDGAMHCHHMSYSRVGTPEEYHDVQGLCLICHLQRHRRFSPEHLKAMLRKQIF